MVFNYFVQIKNERFNKDLCICAFCLAIALGIRNTSIVGWAPLLVYKMFEKKAILTFIEVALCVALPTIILTILIDSIYYG